MAERDTNREPDEHYVPVEWTDSTKRDAPAMEKINSMSDGAAKKAAEDILRRKRRNAAALKQSRQR